VRFKPLFSILTDHKVKRVHAKAGFGKGFLKFGLVGLQVFDFRLINGWVEAGEDIEV
jgi:hypothetical protein